MLTLAGAVPVETGPASHNEILDEHDVTRCERVVFDKGSSKAGGSVIMKSICILGEGIFESKVIYIL